MLRFIVIVNKLNIPKLMMILVIPVIPVIYFIYSDGYINRILSGITTIAYGLISFYLK